ncbi:MAG TPA: glycosyltransferase family 2 protein [Blastocatellia bacterium]|nr:glycosyltransferase family 2 protein [Blastocatellia bacterium]
MPEVSVIIPCYNQAQYLTESVQSVLQQTFKDWECIIINDGSADQTQSMALSFAGKDSRIRCVSQPNKGLAAARNRGLDESAGRYIQFLDADDWIAPGKFELQLAVLKTTPALSLSYCDYERYFDDPMRPMPHRERFNPRLDPNNALLDLASNWENELSIPTHCFLFDARFFTEQGIRFDKTLPNHEDWDCWMQILTTDPLILCVPNMLATYRYRADAMSVDLSVMRRGFIRAVSKQKIAFRENDEMYGVLCEKLRSVKSEYRDFTLPRQAYRDARKKAIQTVRALMPSGLRRVLRSLAP